MIRSRFSHLSLGWKFAFAPTLVALFLCVVTAAGALGSARTRDAVQALAASHLPRMARAGAIAERVSHLNGMVNQSLA